MASKAKWQVIAVSAVALGLATGTLLVSVFTHASTEQQDPDERHTFSFSGLNWDERNTPDQATLLGDGEEYGDVQFSEGVPSTTTGAMIRFPDRHQLNARLTVGGLTSLGGAGRSALNLPANSDGTTQRHGVQLEWSAQRRLPNGQGPDFVIYESGTQHIPDGLIVRVRSASTGTWTRWFYTAPAGFELYRRAHNIGAHATVIDLSDLGVAPGVVIDAIQIANLTPRDRIDSATGTATKGFVIADDNGATSNIVPNTGYSNFENDHYDPDVLYVAALRDVVE